MFASVGDVSKDHRREICSVAGASTAIRARRRGGTAVRASVEQSPKFHGASRSPVRCNPPRAAGRKCAAPARAAWCERVPEGCDRRARARRRAVCASALGAARASARSRCDQRVRERTAPFERAAARRGRGLRGARDADGAAAELSNRSWSRNHCPARPSVRSRRTTAWIHTAWPSAGQRAGESRTSSPRASHGAANSRGRLPQPMPRRIRSSFVARSVTRQVRAASTP